MAITQLFYVSKATPAVDDAMIDGILSQARSFNEKQGITGILLFRSGLFLQLLEGDQTPVESLYEKISKDKRHSNVIKFFQVQDNERIFKDWSMGYRKLQDFDIKLINEILSWNRLISQEEKIDNSLIFKMLLRFRDR